MTGPRGRRAIVAGIIAAAIVAGAIAGVVATRDSGEGRSASSEPATGARETPGSKADRSFGPPPEDDGSAQPGQASRAARLEPLIRGRPGRGMVRLAGRGAGTRIELNVSGLPPLEEQYAVWLYNSVSDARRLAAVIASGFTVSRSLPADPASYGFIDVSREPLDGNPNHSGESVLRVPMARLRRVQGP